MIGPTEVRYAEGPEGFVAYQVVGDGPPMILVNYWGSSFELLWDLPLAERMLRRLASFSQLILFDQRGTGASDPLPQPYVEGDFSPTVEQAVTDIRTVLDEVAVERATLLGTNAGTTAAITFAATHPDRTSALVLFDPMLKTLTDDEYRFGLTAEARAAVAEIHRERWGTGMLMVMAPSLADEPDVVAWQARSERLSSGRGVMGRYWEVNEIDIRPLLPLIQAPTLVFDHKRSWEPGEMFCEGIAAYTGEHAPNTVGVHTVPTPDFALWAPHPEWVWNEVETLVSGEATTHSAPADRIFATVLFTDLVDSTGQAVELGDRRWREILDVHDSTARREIEHGRGRLVKHTGDGVLATFDGPARAVQTAQRIADALRPLEISIRAGVHAGEVELRGEDVGGIAVHIAARVMGEASAGEVLLSRTVKDLVAGSNLEFEDRGVHTLKGIPDPWQLYAAT